MPSAPDSVRATRAATRALIVSLALGLACAASAQTFYKWVDKDGKVNFADRPPVGFKGEVTVIQADAQPEPVARPLPKAPKADAQPDGDGAPDVATRRRQIREQLGARLAAARAKLEAARKALADGDEATQEEKQFVQQRFDRDARRPERTPPPRSNCMSRNAEDGKAIWVCPRPIPGEAYFERQRRLEEAVRKAEEELAEAERAYRRGVD